LNKSGIRVFIIDDDPSISSALREIIKNMGFLPVVCPNPAEMLNQFRIQGGHLAIIDCLLPKMPGVELAKNIKSEFGENIPIILCSGVYRDKGFIKDALQQTGAVGFFSKPFQVPELQDMVNKVLEGKFDEDAMPLENLLTAQLSPAEKIQEINNLKQVEAYDIPWLCCSIMNSSITGVLKFQSEKEKAVISFFEGRITQVEMQNPESFFGALLIEKGYITGIQIEQALAQKNSKKLGERLVDMNVLSPHIISSTNAEQTAIRLSKIISDVTYNVSFSEDKVVELTASIDTETITPFLIDWLNSKIPSTWIKQRYLKWLNSPPMRSSATQTYHRLWNIPPLKNVPELVTDFTKGITLSQALSKAQYKEDLVYQVFHLLIIVGHLQLKREIKPLDEIAQITRLHKILEDMKTQDYFAMLGMSRSAKGPEIKKTYYELAKIFHPDKIPGNASEKLKELAQSVFSQMTRSYETLSDETKRADYIKEMEVGRAEKVLQAEGYFEDAKALLKLGQAAKALQQFDKVLKLRPANSEIWVHYAWAKMLSGEGKLEDRLVEVEGILNKIPPEDRHNAIYYFVKAMYQKMVGDEGPAKKNLQNALALNPKFVDAERLLRTFDQGKKKGGADIFRGDLKDVVGSLFRKK
jgi:FixJ family two-component response regulator/curved DNA-binding protein CbpA